MRKSWYLVLLLLLSMGMASVETLSALKGFETESSTQLLWSITFLVLTIFWVMEDLKVNDFEKPFEFGFLLYILWPITFPWYLISTRGIDGIIFFVGFVSIYLGPWLSGLLAYVYFT